MVTGTGLAASEARARHWLAMMAFAAIGAALADGVSEDRVSAALVGGAVGAIPVSVGDSAGDGVGASAGVHSGTGRLTGIARGGTGMAITAFLTLMRIPTSPTFNWEEAIACSCRIVS